MRYPVQFLVLFATAAILAACGAADTKTYLEFRALESPAAEGSGQSNLFTGASGDVYLSWIEEGEQKEHALRYAVLPRGSESWSEAITLIEDDEWFVNWADFPSLLHMENDIIAAHWLKKVPGGHFAYHVNMGFFQDPGQITGPIRPHLDDSPTEHGFVSMVPISEERVMAVWLDGRNMDGHQGDMTIRGAEVDIEGNVHNKQEIDARVCECCQTSAVKTGESVIIAYRDRSEDEIRDISLSRYYNGRWSEPKTVHDDNWRFMGCPVNGPALASSGDQGGVVWFTGTGRDARVWFARFDETLENIGEPVRIDDGYPIGRVDAVMQEDGTAWVSWVEMMENGAENRIRRVSTDGETGEAITLHPLDPNRSSGFPRMALSDDRLIVTWSDTEEPGFIRTGVMGVR